MFPRAAMRRGSYDDAVASLRPHLQNLAHRRRSAPSLAFSRALGKTWTPIREEGLGQVPANQSPFVLGLTNENAELTLDERVQLTEGQKTKERQLFLFSDILVIAKLKASSSSYRLKHRVNLEQLWIVSFEDEEDEEDEEGDAGINLKASLFLAWPLAQCVVSFRSPEVKERWLDTLHRKIREATERSGSPSPRPAGLMTVLSGSVTCKTLGGVMDSVIEVPTDGKASAAQEAEPLCNAEGRGCHPIEKMGGGWRLSHFLQRKRRESSTHSDSGPAPREPLLFSQPLSKVCGGDEQLPQPITDMLMLLLKKGVFTEGVFRKAANARSLKEIRELLNSGTEVELESKPVTLLAALLKDFLRQIPGSLLVAEEYTAWMATLETQDLPERRAQLRQVINRLPPANGVLLQHLLCVLHHISRNTATNKMDAKNLSICIGPNLLQHSPEPEVVSKVTDLTQFLIENCCEIFGEQIQSLLGNPDEEELADNLDSLSSHQHDSAYDSTDPDAEGDAPGHHDDVPKPLPRRRSEPALFLSAVAPGDALHGGLLLARSHEDCSGFQERPLQKPASQDSFLRPTLGQRSAPPPLRGSWGEVATSSCSLESSLSNQSEGSVFTSSPLASPVASRRSPFPRQQSLRLPAPPPAPAAAPPQEKEEKVKRRSQSMRSSGMARVRSWSTFTRGGSLKKADAPQPKEGGAFPCETLQEDPASPTPAPVRPRPRPLSAIEVFQEVDRRIPGPPPSYDVAPPPQPPLYRTLTVSGARELERRSRPASVSEDFLLPPGPAEDTPTQPEAPPPATFRLRAMSESVSRGNNNDAHDKVNRRCSQPLFEEMLYAKESYV